MVVPPLTKSEFRRELKIRRDRFVSQRLAVMIKADLEALSRRVAPRISAPVAAAYIPIGSEIGTHPLIQMLASAGHVIALPYVKGREDPLRFLSWKPGAPLVAGPLGVMQPCTDSPEVSPGVILTPLLGFDNMLNRIGYGAGHYDRAFLAHPRALRIGLAWSIQRCDHIPVDAWDVPLHAVATEQTWISR